MDGPEKGEALPLSNGWHFLLLLTAVALVYGNSLQGSFHYDDFHSIVDNPHIRRLGNVPAFFADPTLFSGDAAKAMYRPVLLVTYALNYAVGGYEVTGYHLVNIAMHAFNACMVWWLAVLLGRRDLALWAGLLFAVHPVCTEPVNYISSRSESLVAAFYLLSSCFFIYGEERPDARFRIYSWMAFGLGLLSKSTAITLPGVLLLYDYFFISHRDWVSLGRNLAKRHGPYCLLAGGYILTISLNGFLTRSISEPVREGGVQFFTQTVALVYYGVLLVMPVGLNVEHQFFEQSSPEAPVVMAALLLVLSLVGLLIYHWRLDLVRFLRLWIGISLLPVLAMPRRHDLALFLNLWMGIALLPVLAMPLNVLVNERRLYLVCAAFCIGLACLLPGRLTASLRLAGREVRMALALALLLSCGLLTLSRNAVWSDELTLWQDAVAKSPAMPRPHAHLGNALRQVGQLQRAEEAFEATLALDSQHRAARTNLANLRYEAARAEADAGRAQQHYRRAVREYKKVLALDSTYVEALNGLGNAYRTMGDGDAAGLYYRRVIALQPHFAQAHFNLASLLVEQADYGRAVDIFKRALELERDAETYAGLGRSLFRLERFGEAEEAYLSACQLAPKNVEYHYNLGIALLQRGERAPGERERMAAWRRARSVLEKVAELDPGYRQVKVEILLKQLAEKGL